MYTYHCHNTEHVHVPLSQYRTCTRTTVTIQNMYTPFTMLMDCALIIALYVSHLYISFCVQLLLKKIFGS